MAELSGPTSKTLFPDTSKLWHLYLVVLLFAGAIYLGCIVSPPSLMDDVDAVHAQIARTMLTSGDWVTSRIDGVPYFEKAPAVYWAIAISYKIFGVHDWSARIPIALSAIALCLLTTAIGVWAFGKRAGFYAGLCLSTCIGLFLFTRILIPDVMLTFTTALAMWAFLRIVDEEEARARLWAFLLAVALGAGLLLKSLIAVVFPIGAALVYLLITHQLFSARIWQRLQPFSSALIVILIAAPWHILATVRNPPYFAFTLYSGPGQYHGFLWFFVINEQLLRFLGRRFPHDYNTVPRLYFWLFHLIWLFPWSVYFPAVAKLSFKPIDRAGRTRLLALCWAGFVLIFFTFSTTQEYYSMPSYPALALLLGSAMAANGDWVRRGTRALAVISACAALAALAIHWDVRNLPAPGDISEALSHHPNAYTLSLGHTLDLTLPSFAYLRVPLLIAAFAALIGAVGNFRAAGVRAFFASALMMVLFLHAARVAMVVFDPYLSSRPLAEALLRSPEGTLISQRHYYPFSSVYFYANRRGLLLNGRIQNLEYGSNAPGAPDVFIDDQQFVSLWDTSARYYLLAVPSTLPHLESLVGAAKLNIVKESGGKVLLTNQPLPGSAAPQDIGNAQP
ncbi:MAG: glycosyltransferase family 39 protein [Candidatus Acidiferrales bacterium]